MNNSLKLGSGSCDQFVYGVWGEYSGYYSPICLLQLTTVDIGKANPVGTRLTQFLALLNLARVTFTLRFNNTHRVRGLLQTIVCVPQLIHKQYYSRLGQHSEEWQLQSQVQIQAGSDQCIDTSISLSHDWLMDIRILINGPPFVLNCWSLVSTKVNLSM